MLPLLLIACSSLRTDENRSSRLGDAHDAEEALALAGSIEDPYVRSSAVTRWVEVHREALQPEQARSLCDTLTGVEVDRCWHIYSSAHLR